MMKRIVMKGDAQPRTNGTKSLIAFGSMLIMSAGPLNAAPIIGQQGMNDIIERKLTRAECKKKKGYIWSEKKGRCVKDTRGSH